MNRKYLIGLAGWLLIAGLWFGGARGAPAQSAAPTNPPAPAVAPAQPAPKPITSRWEKQTTLTFGLDHVEALQEPLLGNPLWRYAASLIYILLAFAVTKLLDLLLGVEFRKWTGKTKTEFDDLLLDLLHGPFKVVAFVILLHLGLNIFDWPAWVTNIFSKGLLLILACSLTYTALKFIDLLMLFWKRRLAAAEDKLLDKQLLPVIRNSLKAFLVVVAVLLTCQNLGMNITSVIASLSIGGLALGLAAQDTLANLFGAVSVFVDKPFRIGDDIKLNDLAGTVESIGLRSTRIRNPEGHLITVPNKTMGNAAITNVTRRPRIKTVMDFGLPHDTPAPRVKQAVAILTEIYKNHPMTSEVLVSFNQFTPSALNIQVIHFWKNTDYKAYLAGIQDMNLLVKERLDAADLRLAVPTRTVYVRQATDGRP
jgi:MscS family membrane protein